MARAREYYRKTVQLPDGPVIFVVIWELPAPTEVHPHGFRYRLNYCTADGVTLVRYDNHRGKGDHKHLGDNEVPYKSQDLDT